MGQRTRKDPEVTDSFLWRICHALDEPPRLLAKNIGVDYKDLHPLLSGSRTDLPEIDRDEVWFKINAYVSTRLGLLMAVRDELNRALQKDRAARVVKVERFKRYHVEKTNNL